MAGRRVHRSRQVDGRLGNARGATSPGSGSAGHDWCIVRLGARGIVRGVDVDTAHFKGNYPESCALDVCDDAGRAGGLRPGARRAGARSLPRSPLQGDAHNIFAVTESAPRAHPRTCGCASFPTAASRGCASTATSVPDWERCAGAAMSISRPSEHGGLVVACSDMFFGIAQQPDHARAMREHGRRMGDAAGGAAPGHDWTIIRLGAPGSVERVEVDTRHFKGNAPGACSLEACVLPAHASRPGGIRSSSRWRELLPRTPLAGRSRDRLFERSSRGWRGAPTCGSIFFRTAASRGCGCSDGWHDARRAQRRWSRRARRRSFALLRVGRWARGDGRGAAVREPRRDDRRRRRSGGRSGADDWLEAFAAHPRDR